MQRRRAKKADEQRSHFRIARSNIDFVPLGNSRGLVTNKTALDFQFDFDDDTPLPVEESRDVVCVGNVGKWTANVQLSWAASDVVTLRVEPKVLVLKRGCAGEFTVYVTPHCTIDRSATCR